MKALKDCKWEVKIIDDFNEYYWCATTKDNNGTSSIDFYGNDCEREERAINHWRKFAELNGITNYKIL